MQLSESEMDHKKTLQELNTRLVAYVDKVRKLQRTTDAIDSLPRLGSEYVNFFTLFASTFTVVVNSPFP